MDKIFRVHIEFDQCKACGRCIIACPRKILALGKKLNRQSYPAAYQAKDGCIGCGACFYQCPEPGAVTVYEIVEA